MGKTKIDIFIKKAISLICKSEKEGERTLYPSLCYVMGHTMMSKDAFEAQYAREMRGVPDLTVDGHLASLLHMICLNSEKAFQTIISRTRSKYFVREIVRFSKLLDWTLDQEPGYFLKGRRPGQRRSNYGAKKELPACIPETMMSYWQTLKNWSDHFGWNIFIGHMQQHNLWESFERLMRFLLLREVIIDMTDDIVSYGSPVLLRGKHRGTQRYQFKSPGRSGPLDEEDSGEIEPPFLLLQHFRGTESTFRVDSVATDLSVPERSSVRVGKTFEGERQIDIDTDPHPEILRTPAQQFPKQWDAVKGILETAVFGVVK